MAANDDWGWDAWVLSQEEEEEPPVADIVQPLVDSVKQGNMEKLRAILSQKKKDEDTVDSMDRAIDTAMDEAAAIGHLQACQALYKKLSNRRKSEYADVEIFLGEFHPLHWAASECKKAVVRFLVRDCNYNINQIDHNCYDNYTPLISAMQSVCGDAASVEITRFLLKYGADPNQLISYDPCPLFIAVQLNNAELVHLLLEYKANPNLIHIRGSEEHEDNDDWPTRNNYIPLFYAVHHNQANIARILLEHGADLNLTRDAESANNQDRTVAEMAIMNGNVEILDMVLDYGALPPATLVQDEGIMDSSTALNDLLEDTRKSLDTKLEICHILVKHVAFLKSRGFDVLRQAGVNPIYSMYRAIREGRDETCQLLIQNGVVDPFLEANTDAVVNPFVEDNNDNEEYATSPFHAAARQKKTTVLDLFLKHWDERFSANGGKNDNGDYPLHVICCDPKVSLEAIKLVVERRAHALTTVDGEQALFPFHFAAMWDAELDVIYHLLRLCPDAMGRLPRAMNSANGNDISNHSPPLVAALCDGNGKPNGRMQVEDCGPLKKKVKVT